MTNNSSIPKIEPVPPGTHRPFWSVMIPTYNCANYLRETLESVLSQDPGPDQMQIEVIDDCSTKDDPESVVKEIGKGRVDFYRQPKNVGPTRNFNTCLQRSRGQWVHILHGDDAVLPGFYSVMSEKTRNNEQCGMVICRAQIVDADGSVKGTSGKLAPSTGSVYECHLRINRSNPIRTPSVVVMREVYERLGGFDRLLGHTADWEMWMRVAGNYPIWFQDEVLTSYRVHAAADTSRVVISGQYIDDYKLTVQTACTRLGLDRDTFARPAYRAFSRIALRDSAKRLRERDMRGLLRMLLKAIKLDPSWACFKDAFVLFSRSLGKSLGSV